MKKLTLCAFVAVILLVAFGFDDCGNSKIENNQTALDEQVQTEQNQRELFQKQPPPRLTWSLERDNLIKRFKLQNDRAINFYMYVFIEGVGDPVGYYLVNKVSSVDSQLTNTTQIVRPGQSYITLPSPAEDGSYGTNGNGVFGFTPEDIYIEHNMKYIVSTVPLTFAHPVQRLAVVNTDEARQMLEKTKQAMSK
jgi:hypothetical protein